MVQTTNQMWYTIYSSMKKVLPSTVQRHKKPGHFRDRIEPAVMSRWPANLVPASSVLPLTNRGDVWLWKSNSVFTLIIQEISSFLPNLKYIEIPPPPLKKKWKWTTARQWDYPMILQVPTRARPSPVCSHLVALAAQSSPPWRPSSRAFTKNGADCHSS